MKKILIGILFGTVFIFSSCTGNTRARLYGGTQTIVVPTGFKVVEATWKNSELWYLTEPMDSTYTPKTKIFQESSNFGIAEGKVIFIESK